MYECKGSTTAPFVDIRNDSGKWYYYPQYLFKALGETSKPSSTEVEVRKAKEVLQQLENKLKKEREDAEKAKKAKEEKNVIVLALRKKNAKSHISEATEALCKALGLSTDSIELRCYGEHMDKALYINTDEYKFRVDGYNLIIEKV